MCNGSPALPPGVSTRTAVPAQYAASSGSPICQWASPARRSLASSRGHPLGDRHLPMLLRFQLDPRLERRGLESGKGE